MNIPNIFARGWEALPKLPGVYQFHGDSDTMPLYIGKSVNLRSRGVIPPAHP
ncbi:excinuclease cho (excinuclease ABC alternative C subunit) [Klebsiella pneumoniae]|uniref:Excinuclease cho (Excinuclease ABC alternative C subunit) n=1 Tax=Klebsiella pneumoniae TaxID=573 RepID=A0A377XVP5_KLEPN|nr:excinuclease cho (excinuclease ABC alternative C subunit) [Klebsiella pneumoniae]